MKRRSPQGERILMVVLLLICLISSLLVTTVFAAETGEVTLTVKQVFTSTGSATPPSEAFTYKLTPELTSNPMPTGSSESGYTFIITGTDDIDIGPIIFTQMGLYTYEISLITNPQSGYTYDLEVYTLKIYVDYDMPIAVVVTGKDGSKA